MLFHLRLLFVLATIFAISQLASAKKVHQKSHPKATHHHAKVVHESRAAAPQGWQRVKKVHPDAPLNLKIALSQQNLDKADQYIMSVSDPKSPNFGKHWTPQQVAETFAPSEDSVYAVNNWLLNAGFTSEQLSGSVSMGWVNINTTFAQAETLLDAEYHVYEHSRSGAQQVATKSYSLPNSLAGVHVDLVLPSVHFDALPPQSMTKKMPGMKYGKGQKGQKKPAKKAAKVSQ